MIYKYKCTWVDVKQDSFTIGKIYTLDTEKKTFFDDNRHNWWVMISKSDGSYETNPKKWSFVQREFVAIPLNYGEKKITIKCNGNEVIARMGTRTGKAKCHEEDNFDYYTGAKLALDRLFKKDDSDDMSEYEKHLYRLGDKVKVVNPGLTYANDIEFFERNCKHNPRYKEWAKRYAYNDDLGYLLKAKNSYLYNDIYGYKRYTILFICDDGRYVIEDCDSEAVYIVHRNGLEKVKK